jgi:hypothetical protein
MLYLIAVICLDFGLGVFRTNFQYTFNSKNYLYTGKHFLFFKIALLILVLAVLNKVGVMHNILFFKGISLILNVTMWSAFFGIVAALAATRRLKLALSLIILYSFYVSWVSFIDNDVSRFSFVSIFILILIFLYFSEKIKKRIIQKSYVFIALLVIITGFQITKPSNIEFGGDRLILLNVANIIDLVDNTSLNFELPMFIFNLGLVVIPEELWLFGTKPIAYNPSAWFIANSMKIDALKYPWGIGVGGIGASYLYYGILGVAIIYFLMGAFMSWVKRWNSTPFHSGVYIYFLFHLPYSAFRMDETFLWGFPIFTIPFLYLLLSSKTFKLGDSKRR